MRTIRQAEVSSQAPTSLIYATEAPPEGRDPRSQTPKCEYTTNNYQ